MSTFYIKKEQIIENSINIFGEDVNHIKNVLRYKIDDEIDVCDDSGIRYKTKITGFSNEKVNLKIESVSNETTEPGINVTLYQGLPKSDKMELIIQKCTEIGVKAIVPVITDRVIVKLDEKSENKKRERWQKIAKEAAVQSGRQIIPSIEKTVNFKNIVEKLSKYDIVIMPYEAEKEYMLKNVLRKNKNDLKNIAIIIGPEGGFSEKDIEIAEKISVLEKVSLGSRILRTETAGIVTLAMVIYELDSD